MSAVVDPQARSRMVQRRPHTPNLFDLMPYRRVRGAFPAWLLSWADAAAILDTGTVVLLLERLNGQDPIHRLDGLRARFAE